MRRSSAGRVVAGERGERDPQRSQIPDRASSELRVSSEVGRRVPVLVAHARWWLVCISLERGGLKSEPQEELRENLNP